MFKPCPQRRASESDARASRADRRSGRRAGRLGADGPPDRPDPPPPRRLARRQRPRRDRPDRARLRRVGRRRPRRRPTSPRMRRFRLDRLVAADRRPRPRRPPALRPAEHPLRHRLHQHAGLERPQPVPRLPGAARRPPGALGLQARAVPRRPQPAGRRAPLRRLVLLLRHRRGDRRLRRRLRRRGRRRSCAPTPAPTAASPSTRSCSPASARSPPPGSTSRTASPSPSAPAPSRAPTRSAPCAARSTPARPRWPRCARPPAPASPRTTSGRCCTPSNIRRGGEWIETRLLTSGPRTNPWFQECGPRIVQPNEILAFDTDLIGPYGYLRRHLPHLVDRRRPRRAPTCAPTTRSPASRSPGNTALLAARHELRRAARPRLRPARALPRAALLLHLARRRPLRRVALHRLSRGPRCPAPSRACSSPA